MTSRIDTVLYKGNRASASPGVHVFHPKHVTGPYADAKSHIVRTKCSEALHDLTIDFDRYEALSVVVESARSASLAHQTAFERGGGIRRESKERTPQRRNKRPLENDTANRRNNEQ